MERSKINKILYSMANRETVEIFMVKYKITMGK